MTGHNDSIDMIRSEVFAMMEIVQAAMDDFDGVKALLKANHVSNLSAEEQKSGFVTTNLTDDQLEDLIVKENGVTIAREGGRVIAFALAAPWEYWSQWPLFVHMIGELGKYDYLGQKLTLENTYQYGPVCIDRAFRGRGLFERVFRASLDSMAERYPIMITFVNHVNGRSHAAHTRKAGMDVLGNFAFNGSQYYFLACPTKGPGASGSAHRGKEDL